MENFANSISKWQKISGRHDLPWQRTRDPYRVWLSEIMLQQTQVTAVIAYYTRFLEACPTVAALAAANSDTVMQLWAGLGYYARARNLHKAAKIVVQHHGGVFPHQFADIVALPGIGRSTAGAISAFCFGQRTAILDGNVKRVFTRHFGVVGDPGLKPIENALWQLAEAQLPTKNIEAYTQGLMDLGASLCSRAAPKCLLCPLAETCVAKRDGLTASLPTRKVRKAVPHKQTTVLILRRDDAVFIEQRPPAGIWGGLWSLPDLGAEFDVNNSLKTPEIRASSGYQLNSLVGRKLAVEEHGFTHFTLSITPFVIDVSATKVEKNLVAQEANTKWLNLSDVETAALPAPIKRILLKLAQASLRG